jgi:hypothetical protein
MTQAQGWQGEALNQSPESSNRIHSDEVAKEFGFRGGLVPGVTDSSYLTHPAVVAWGMHWLNHGRAHVTIRKPLYDRYNFTVDLSNETDSSYRAILTDQEGTHCADALVDIPADLPDPPVMRGDPILKKDQVIPQATREEMEKLRENGMLALAARWDDQNNMVCYLRDSQKMPELLRIDGGAYANTSYMLGLTNWVLAGNAYMNPWIHLETESQNFAAVPNGSDLICECAITDLFEKKQHQFVDVIVDVYFRDTGAAAMTSRLRAIYKLRGS